MQAGLRKIRFTWFLWLASHWDFATYSHLHVPINNNYTDFANCSICLIHPYHFGGGESLCCNTLSRRAYAICLPLGHCRETTESYGHIYSWFLTHKAWVNTFYKVRVVAVQWVTDDVCITTLSNCASGLITSPFRSTYADYVNIIVTLATWVHARILALGEWHHNCTIYNSKHSWIRFPLHPFPSQYLVSSKQSQMPQCYEFRRWQIVLMSEITR